MLDWPSVMNFSRKQAKDGIFIKGEQKFDSAFTQTIY